MREDRLSYKIFRRVQSLPRPPAEVFQFFETPENLARLTPPSLGFEILTPSPIAMRAGALIDYCVRPLGFPQRWTTLIESYDPPRRFTDVQLRGPYSFWHHTHTFEAEGAGTRMTDEVRYVLPFGPFGAPAAPWVESQLKKIFDYRAETVAAFFK
jgi:ligand-binding SRPBCC domain-containing protein